MPELPEVENVRRQLEKYLVGHTIKKVEIKYKKCFTGDTNNIEGGKVKKVRRFGKALVIDLNNNYSLVIHIKMTGQLIYRGPKLKNPPELSDKVKDGLTGKHNHVTFHLDKDGELYYVDYRKFGWIKSVETEEVENIDFIKHLGPETPLVKVDQSKDTLTRKDFGTVVQSTDQAIKNLLMNQKKIAGIGNIYANDALFLAKIHPEKKASKLSDKEIKRLYNSINKVLKKGLDAGGASELAFVTPDGTEGNYQDHTLAYGKEGDKCPKGCGGKIKKIKVSGRGTYFCPKCQKK